MTRLIFLIATIFQSISAISQGMQVRYFNRRMYVESESAVEFSLKKKFDSVNLRATQGSVTREGNIIRLNPSTTGKDTVFVTFYNRGKLVHLDTIDFDIIRHEVFPSFGESFLLDRKLSLPYLKALGGIIFRIYISDGHWEGSGVESYRFSIIREDSCIYSKIEYSSRFSDELKSNIDILKPGDKILISDASVHPRIAKISNILPGVFEIE